MQDYPPPPQGTPTQGHPATYPPASNGAGAYPQHGSPPAPMHLPPNQSPQLHNSGVTKPPPVASLQGSSPATVPAQPTYHPPPSNNLGSKPVVLVCGHCQHRGPTTVTSDNCTLVNWMCTLFFCLCCFFLFPGTSKHTHTCSNCGAYLGSNNMV